MEWSADWISRRPGRRSARLSVPPPWAASASFSASCIDTSSVAVDGTAGWVEVGLAFRSMPRTRTLWISTVVPTSL